MPAGVHASPCLWRLGFHVVAEVPPARHRSGHVVSAAFAFGREHIIPLMFRALLERMNITEQQAPGFFYYLQRHIRMDEESHGPLTLLLLDELCGSDPVRQAEADAAACDAISARIHFWDGVL